MTLNLSGVSFEKLISDEPIVQKTPPINDPSSTPSDPAKSISDPPSNPPSNPPSDPAKVVDPPVDDPTKVKDPTKDPAKEGDDPAKEEPKTALEFFKQNLGYAVEGEFEDSLDGLLDFTRSAIPVAAEAMINELFDKYPDAEKLIQHLDAGHSIDTFSKMYQKPEYVKVEISATTDPKILESVMRQDLTERGYIKEDIDGIVNMAKDTKVLFDRAKKAQEAIDARHQASVKSQMEAEAIQNANDAKKAQEAAKKAQDIIESGKLPNSIIPDSDKKAFRDFIFSANDKGVTARDEAISNLTTEEMLYLDYIIFKGGTKPKQAPDNSGKSIYEELMGKRSSGRMNSQKTITPTKPIVDPKNSLKGVEFGTFLS